MKKLDGWRATAGVLAALMIGCPAGDRNGGAGSSEAASDAELEPLGAEERLSEAGVILFVGTSLTAGLGLSSEAAYPARVQEKIDSAGLPYRVVNAGVSGETSAGALRRIDWLVEQPFDVLVLETGANDMLQGAPAAEVERNIQAILDRVREERPQAVVILAGMRAAPNLGARYVEEFEAIYPRLAERNRLPLLPFLLEGVAANPSLNQGDGIHPNAAGQQRVAENVWEVLERVLPAEAAAP